MAACFTTMDAPSHENFIDLQNRKTTLNSRFVTASKRWFSGLNNQAGELLVLRAVNKTKDLGLIADRPNGSNPVYREGIRRK